MRNVAKSIQIVSEQGITGPDIMANLVWARTSTFLNMQCILR